MLLRALNTGAVVVFALSLALGVALLGWAFVSGTPNPLVEAVTGAARLALMETADPLDPATVARGDDVIALIRSGDLRPSFEYDWDVLAPDSNPGLTWAYEAVIRLPQEYEDLSFRGEVDALYFPGNGDLAVTLYQDGGTFGPDRDHYLLYDSGDKGDWTPGPGGKTLADRWWYVADADWMLDPALWEKYGEP